MDSPSSIWSRRRKGCSPADSSALSHVPRPASCLPLGRDGRTRFHRAGSLSRNSGSAPPRLSLRRGPVHRSRSEEHTSELQSQFHLVCRLLLEKKKKSILRTTHTIL